LALAGARVVVDVSPSETDATTAAGVSPNAPRRRPLAYSGRIAAAIGQRAPGRAVAPGHAVTAGIDGPRGRAPGGAAAGGGALALAGALIVVDVSPSETDATTAAGVSPNAPRRRPLAYPGPIAATIGQRRRQAGRSAEARRSRRATSPPACFGGWGEGDARSPSVMPYPPDHRFAARTNGRHRRPMRPRAWAGGRGSGALALAGGARCRGCLAQRDGCDNGCGCECERATLAAVGLFRP
jgi:hypothetical protein